MDENDEKVLGLLENVRAFRRSDDYPAAWKQLELANGICPGNRHDMLGRLKAMEGQLVRDEGNIQEAIVHYRSSLEHFEKSNDQLKVAHTLRHLAEMEEERDQMETARKYFEQCRSIYESLTEASKMDLANFYRAYAVFLEKDKAERSITLSYWGKAREIYAEFGIAEGVEECDDHLK